MSGKHFIKHSIIYIGAYNCVLLTAFRRKNTFKLPLTTLTYFWWNKDINFFNKNIDNEKNISPFAYHYHIVYSNILKGKFISRFKHYRNSNSIIVYCVYVLDQFRLYVSKRSIFCNKRICVKLLTNRKQKCRKFCIPLVKRLC